MEEKIRLFNKIRKKEIHADTFFRLKFQESE